MEESWAIRPSPTLSPTYTRTATCSLAYGSGGRSRSVENMCHACQYRKGRRISRVPSRKENSKPRQRRPSRTVTQGREGRLDMAIAPPTQDESIGPHEPMPPRLYWKRVHFSGNAGGRQDALPLPEKIRR